MSNKHKISTFPIGIFDSGIGGLTVAHAVKKALPKEHIVYFGDTAHLPYGEKSAHALQAYSIKSIDFLLQKKCKLILIACNSASAAAYDLAKEYVGSKAIVVNVIDPVVRHVCEFFKSKKVGLIGTRQTIHSGTYEKKIKEKNCGITLKSVATPLLAGMIEEGFYNKSISRHMVAEYLSHPDLIGVEALILGCTHYPLIRKEISEFMGEKVEIIDGSQIVSSAVREFLLQNETLNTSDRTGRDRFFVSDYTESFEKSTEIFFQKKIKLQLFKLWE